MKAKVKQGLNTVVFDILSKKGFIRCRLSVIIHNLSSFTDSGCNAIIGTKALKLPKIKKKAGRKSKRKAEDEDDEESHKMAKTSDV
ncbi:MAG: hypothetical protein EOP45_10155 [Sphingobacteriaceae bacterium]|nr:MAG: hypothetical protein EOP45_10155 [Sphingobacteriaceae bacterium]